LDKKSILICPLDWGLGHATRCVPIITELLNQNYKVLIGASDRSADLLRAEFPKLTIIPFSGYEISYPERGSMIVNMSKQIPRLISRIAAEKREVRKIVKDYQIDGIISDNRFGLGIAEVPTAYITHQVKIATPSQFRFLEPVLKYLHQRILNRYNEVWIPDYSGENNLSGRLSHDQKLPVNTHFIGPLSRFNKDVSLNETPATELLVIISGPEPQRTMFEWMILRQLDGRTESVVIVRGAPESQRKVNVSDNITVVDHLPAMELNQAICNASIIVARSGYSTIMDLSKLGKQAIFIPTPGQTEQEYLAELLKNKNVCYSEPQDGFDLERSLSMVNNFSGFKLEERNGNILKTRIQSLFGTVQNKNS